VALAIPLFSLAERTAYVGREAERGAIRAAIDRALDGDGSLVMLEGGAGLGKTRLAMEMADYAARKGFQCFVGRCYERDEPFPYLPFVEIIESNLAQATNLDDFRRQLGDDAAELARLAPSLRRVFPAIPEPLELPSTQKRRYLFQSVFETLARAALRRPQLNILDDLHWADESTLALLFYLASRVTQIPVVIIGTFRDDNPGNKPALARTLEELIRLGIRPLKLGGLPRDAVAQMLNALSRREAPENLARAIFEESQGNPFFVEEVYRHLVEEGKVFDTTGEFRSGIQIDEIDVPESVRLVVGRRLERLDENEKRVLAAAAAIGRSFSFQLLSQISHIDLDELFTVIEKAQQMGIVVSSSEGPETPFIFAHEIVRQTLLAGISSVRRQQLHASVADAIERLDPHAVDEHAGEIADHLALAKSFADPHNLVRWLTVVGKRELQLAAYEEARRTFQSALSHQDARDVRERAALLTDLAIAEGGLERWDALFATLREALETNISLGDRELAGKGFTDLTDALILAGRFEEASQIAGRGLAYLEGDLSADRARLLAAIGQARAAGASYEPAQEALQQALDLSSQLADPKLTARVLSARCIVYFHFFRSREAAADGFRSEQLDGSEDAPWQRAVHLRMLHQTLLYLGRPEEAARFADQLEPLARKIGQSYSVALCMFTRAWSECGRTPDFAKFESTLRQAANLIRSSHVFWKTLLEVQLSLLDLFRGNWDSALAHAVAASRHERGSSIEGFGTGAMFRQMAYAGDRAGALAVLDRERSLLPLTGQPTTRGSWLMLASVIEGLVMLGEATQAAQLYPLARELTDSGTVALWPLSRFAHTIAGVAAAAGRQYEAAEEHFRLSLRQAKSFPNRLEQVEIRRFHAMMLTNRAAEGDYEEAKGMLGEALSGYGEMGMPRHSEIARALLDSITAA
jgi:tetratricopeptide (TPR) repeat protein